MAWNPSGLAPIEITVDGRIDGQMIVNKYWMMSESPGVGVTDGALLALNWIDLYRARILINMYNWFSVFRYTFREISGAILADPGPPPRYRTLYTISGIAVVAGVVGTDVGANPLPGGGTKLPAHEALRVFKTPVERRLKYFKGNYNRYAGFTLSEKSPTAELWSAAALGAFDVNFAFFNSAHIAGNVTSTVTWRHAVWSPQYFSTLVPVPQANNGALFVQSYRSDIYVGTQTSRRYSPSGQFKGA